MAIGGFIAYRVWPPGAEYLYKQAEVLMASTDEHDWKTARDEYLDPLDQRFKDNPYREQTQKWRDKILLDEADSRGRNLASGLDIPLTRPNTNAERKFVIANELATGAHKRGDDLTAIREWQDFAQQVKPDVPDERKWHLLALHRAEQLENEIKDRHQYVAKQIELANIADQANRHDEAQTIRSKLIEQFSKFTDLADVFPPALAAPGAEAKAPAATEEKAGDNPEPARPAPPERPAGPTPHPGEAPSPSDSEPK
jgi:serine/threonine-protein kinase